MSNYYCVIMATTHEENIVATVKGRNGREVWAKLGYHMEAYPLASFTTHCIFIQPEHEVDPELIGRFNAHA